MVRLELQSRDRPILQSFYQMFKDNGYQPSLTDTTKDGRDYCLLRINSTALVHQLAASGITARKTYTVPFFDFLPDHLLHDYLRGVVDGDGSIIHRKNSLVVEICSASSGFIHTLNDSLERLGIPQHRIDIRTRNRRSPLYRITLWRYAPTFLQQVYYPGCLCLQRKLQVFTQFSKHPDRKITWSPEQDRFLWVNQDLPILELCSRLGKTRGSITARLHRLRKSFLSA
jgi:hypothetical protein